MRRAARNLEALLVPWLHRVATSEDPRFRGGNRIASGDQQIHQPDLVCFGRRHRFAVEQHFERRLHTDQARQALCPTAAGQQPDARFGKRELGLLAADDAVMACERELHAAAQRLPLDRARDRLSARLQPAKHRMARREAPEVGIEDFARTGRVGRSGELVEIGQIAAHAKAAFRGRNHHALDRRVGANPLHDLAQFGDRFVAQRVGGAAVHVEQRQRDAVGIDLDRPVLHRASSLAVRVRRARSSPRCPCRRRRTARSPRAPCRCAPVRRARCRAASRRSRRADDPSRSHRH